MHVALRCPCGANLKAPVKYVGRELKCPKCSKMLVVPEPPMAQTSEPTELEVLEPYDMPVSQAPVMPVAASPIHPASVARKPAASKSKSNTRWPILVAIAGVLVAVFGGVLWYLYSSTTPQYEHQLKLGGGVNSLDDLPDAPAPPPEAPPTFVNTYDSGVRTLSSVTEKRDNLSLPELISEVDPSIVRISVVEVGGAEKIGSGFFIDTEGKIFTNNHVIERAESVTISTVDGKKAKALGYLIKARDRDLAIIQINPADFDCVPIKVASELPAKGDDIVAFGAPAGFSFSQTEGTVSSVRPGEEVRAILNEMAPRQNIYEQKKFANDMSWIQHSASISGGNSGGPLVNMRGEVVGVNTWTHQLGQNLNFASTMDQLQRVFKDREKEITPFLGSRIEDTSAGTGKRQRARD